MQNLSLEEAILIIISISILLSLLIKCLIKMPLMYQRLQTHGQTKTAAKAAVHFFTIATIVIHSR